MVILLLISAHLIKSSNTNPHRAFSLFLFDFENNLLIQKRSSKKITFPNLWSNSCCSHPLAIEPEEAEEESIGIKRAGTRRLEYELGYKLEVEMLYPVERILYKATSNPIFEEFESKINYIILVDYIILAKANLRTIDFKINPSEVSEIQFLPVKDIVSQINSNQLKITPWFELLIRNGRLEFFLELMQDNKFKEYSKKNINKLTITNYL